MRGSSAQAGAVPCPLVELNVGTVPTTPPWAPLGWLGAQPAPTPWLCSPDWPQGAQKPQPPIHPSTPQLWQERVPMGRACRAL